MIYTRCLQTIHQVTMPLRRSSLRLRPVNRIKHVKDFQSAITAGTTESSNLILTSDTPDLATSNEVETGCTVNGIFLVVEVVATSSAALSNVYMSITKNPGGNITAPVPNVVGISDNKRFVIHQEMVMLQQQTNSNPRTLFKGVIVIPRGYRRFGPNDLLQISLLAPGVNINYCVQCHYKEFR